MPSSGSFTTSSCEGRSLTFNWSVKSQSISTNQTTINWSLVGSGSYTSGWVTCGNFKVTIEGNTVYSSSTRINVYSGTVVASGTYTFTHSSNGTKSFTAYAEAGIYYVAVNCSGSNTWSLPTITRQATITSAPNFNDEANPTIYYTNPAGTAVTSLQACISLTGANADVSYRNITITGTSYTFNLTTAERNTLRQATTGKTRTVYFVVKTVINGTTLTNSKAVTFSIINGSPTIASLTYQDSNASTVAITGNNQQIIQNQSTLQLNIGAVAALKYATISKVEYSINGYTVNITSSYTNPVAVGTINYSTNFNLNVIVTDSRGFTTTETITITMLAWKLPYATISLARQSNYYSATDMTVNAYFSSVDSHNSVTIQYKYKKVSDSTYSSPVTISNGVQTTASFDNQYDFDFQFIITDVFGSTTYNMVLAKGIPLMFWDTNLNSVGINCFPRNNNELAIMGNLMVGGTISNNNLFNHNTLVAGSITNSDPTLRISSRQILWLAAGTYTFSTNLTSTYNFAIEVESSAPPPYSTWPSLDYDSSWLSTSPTTFTLSSGGYFILAIRKADNSTLTLSDIINFNYKLEVGSVASQYEPYQIIDYSRVAGIIESGSNSNGNYIKYGDGTMICTKKVSFNNTFTTAWGSMYTTDQISLGNWPVGFTEVPTVNASIMSNYSAFIQGIDGCTITAVGSTYLARPVNTNAQGYISIMAIGRWK